jgi:hypothetical protein
VHVLLGRATAVLVRARERHGHRAAHPRRRDNGPDAGGDPSLAVSYGTASFTLKANTTGKVKVKLDAAGRKLVKAHKKVKVWANVRFTVGGGKPKSTRVTLKR